MYHLINCIAVDAEIISVDAFNRSQAVGVVAVAFMKVCKLAFQYLLADSCCETLQQCSCPNNMHICVSFVCNIYVFIIIIVIIIIMHILTKQLRLKLRSFCCKVVLYLSHLHIKFDNKILRKSLRICSIISD